MITASVIFVVSMAYAAYRLVRVGAQSTPKPDNRTREYFERMGITLTED